MSSSRASTSDRASRARSERGLSGPRRCRRVPVRRRRASVVPAKRSSAVVGRRGRLARCSSASSTIVTGPSLTSSSAHPRPEDSCRGRNTEGAKRRRRSARTAARRALCSAAAGEVGPVPFCRCIRDQGELGDDERRAAGVEQRASRTCRRRPRRSGGARPCRRAGRRPPRRRPRRCRAGCRARPDLAAGRDPGARDALDDGTQAASVELADPRGVALVRGFIELASL